jgi:hypothetical protein
MGGFPPVNQQDLENSPFLIFQPFFGRVYVNLEEGIHEIWVSCMKIWDTN